MHALIKTTLKVDTLPLTSYYQKRLLPNIYRRRKRNEQFRNKQYLKYLEYSPIQLPSYLFDPVEVLLDCVLIVD